MNILWLLTPKKTPLSRRSTPDKSSYITLSFLHNYFVCNPATCTPGVVSLQHCVLTAPQTNFPRINWMRNTYWFDLTDDLIAPPFIVSVYLSVSSYLSLSLVPAVSRNAPIRACLHRHIHRPMYIYIPIPIYTYIYTYIYVYTYTHADRQTDRDYVHIYIC